jgi:hypothetical protein
MTSPNEIRAELAKARNGIAAAQQELAAKRAELAAARGKAAVAMRAGGAGAAPLHDNAAALDKAVAAQQTKLNAIRATAKELIGRFAATDPQTGITALDGTLPILMFPVRIETRFRTAAAGTPQLWVRIYPDDCQVDAFETLLTQSELDTVIAFWTATWRAGTIDEAQERGAWKALVASSGSPRAAYLIQQYAPADMTKPVKAAIDDIVLVIVPQTVATPAEQAVAITYWKAIWAADGKSAAETAALTILQGAVGATRAAELIAKFAPDPLGWDPSSPKTRADVQVSCAVLNLPPAPVVKTSSWTEPARAALLPDCFVVMGFNGPAMTKRVVGSAIPDGLAVAPDPSLPAGDQIAIVNDDLALNADLQWLADFDAAVANGMGVKIDMTEAEARAGFDRLLVVGLRLTSDASQSKVLLETLIAHQAAGKSGFSLMPQGSPTNNTESDGAAYTWVDDPDASFDRVFKGKDAYAKSDDPLARRDGQWLAQALGIDDALVKTLPNAALTDQLEARAMNMALWNGTAGYMLDEMMPPVFARSDIGAARAFFTRYVSGRGALPAIRVGNQPYGILPALAYSRYRSVTQLRSAGPITPDFLNRLHTLLVHMGGEWKTLSKTVANVANPGADPHQTLLDVVGLQSGSVEYHQRYAESFDQLYNKLVIELGGFLGTILAAFLVNHNQDMLTALGGDPTQKPAILQKFFYGGSPLLQGPVVDDVPLSEAKPIRAYTTDKKQNYIQWLASASLDTIRKQDFGGNDAPTALLYLMLRHAMMLAQWDAGTRMLENKGLVTPAIARVEPSFIHIQSGAAAGQSKLKNLYAAAPTVTGDPKMPLMDYVLLPATLKSAVETEDLREVIAALGILAGVPTARLERVFAEHMDCCSYRLDAWKAGLAAKRIEELRLPPGIDTPRTGLYLGAFGWLENVRRKTVSLTTPTLSTEQAAVFQRTGDTPLEYDKQNAGFVHAPSLNHAAAAAILKNAYNVNASAANPDAMAVNLTSDRVRRAQTILEGMRNGQPLAALLGYRFERGVHDAYTLAEVDKFIYPLRQAFPLAANKLKSTATDGTVDVTLIEARNVIDGLAFVNAMRANPAARKYPFGLALGTAPGQMPSSPTADETKALNAEADALLDLYDALADLTMAESVYQVVMGNFDRAAAVTAAFTAGSHPPEMQVVDTPRTGLTLTHRVALHLDAAASPTVSPSAVAMTPRAAAEAPLNAWLAGRLPAPDAVAVSVTYSSPALAAPKTVTVTEADLGLQPLDLLYLANLDLDQAMSELDDRILQLLRYGADRHPDLAVTIAYTAPVAGKVSFFELSALVRSLRATLLRSRAVSPSDMTMPLESKTSDVVWDDAELAVRLTAARDGLAARRDALVALAADTSDLDGFAALVSAEFLKTALYGVPQAGTGQIHGDIRAIYDAIGAKVQELVTRWQQRIADYAALIATYPGLTTDGDRFALLRKAEGLISATITTPPPALPGDYKTLVDAAKTQFDTDLGKFSALLTFAQNKVVDFAAAAGALAPMAATHDTTAFDISAQTTAIATLRDTVVQRLAAIVADVAQRVDDASAALASLAGLGSSADRVKALTAAAKRVLGDEFLIVPRFKLAAPYGTEFKNAYNGSDALLTDLKASGRRFPVDDWFGGVARVREKLAAWENAGVLSEAFGAATAELKPLQFPFVTDDRWTALEFDTAKAGNGNRMLYTAAFAHPFDPTATQCGLLLDEWPELVPASDLMSGVTFNFDRPKSQPPQTLLLALPPVVQESWSWDDLIATLTETLDEAKMRGVEPAQIDETNYAQFLPATLMAVTLYQITIGTNLALNNNMFDVIGS